MRNAAAIVVRMPGNRVLTLTQCQQRCVTADRRRVDGDGLLGYKTLQIMGPAGFRTGPGEALATERLHADNRADHIAIDVDIADADAPGQFQPAAFDA